MNTLSLFAEQEREQPLRLGPHAVVLREFALADAGELLAAIRQIESCSPFRNMTTPGGLTMSIALTNCGALGWCSDRRGYRYTDIDPLTGRRWPEMPGSFLALAAHAAACAGFPGFTPDACLVNRYLPGTRLSLHQDRNERDFEAPIVSVSLGMSATFLFGGLARSDRTSRIPLQHGDVVVWGGSDRLRYHGILPLKGPPHPEVGEKRFNLTFRKAG